MRYQINEILPVIHFEFKGNSVLENALFKMPYLHYETPVSRINFKLLTVTEHHKVSWEYDEEDKRVHDGYLLRDEAGVTYSNQYPRASYGQVTDTADRRFDLYFGSDQEAEAFFKHAHDKNLLVPIYHLMSDVLQDIQKGIVEITKILEKEHNESLNTKKVKLVALIDRISKEFMIHYPGWRFEVVEEPIVEGSDYLIWKTKFIQDEKIQEEAKGLIETLSCVERNVQHSFDNKDSLCVSHATAHYAMYEPGQEIVVTYGNYEPNYTGDGKDAWMVSSEERFSVNNLKLAVGVYLYRKYHDPLSETGMGQDYDEIFKKKV